MILYLEIAVALLLLLTLINFIKSTIRNKLFSEISIFLYENFDAKKHKISLEYVQYTPSRLTTIVDFISFNNYSYLRYGKIKDLHKIIKMMKKDIDFLKAIDDVTIKKSKGLYLLGNANVLKAKEKQRLLFFIEHIKDVSLKNKAIDLYNLKFKPLIDRVHVEDVEVPSDKNTIFDPEPSVFDKEINNIIKEYK